MSWWLKSYCVLWWLPTAEVMTGGENQHKGCKSMSSGVTHQHMQEHGPFHNDAYSHIPRMLNFNPHPHQDDFLFGWTAAWPRVFIITSPFSPKITPFKKQQQQKLICWRLYIQWFQNMHTTSRVPESRLSSPSRSAILQNSVPASSNKCAACSTPTWSRIPQKSLEVMFHDL